MTTRIVIAGEQLIQLEDCPDLSFSKTTTGDASASLNLPFAKGMRLPRADSAFTIELDGQPIWGGYTGPLDVPELSTCAGQATIEALGWGVTGKRSQDELSFGPKWSGVVLAMAIEDAVKYVVSQLGGEHISLLNANVDSTGVTLQTTESFQGQTMADALNNLAARTRHLATPALWSVRQGYFHWHTMDLAPRYQIFMANGAKVKPRYDPSRVVTGVIVAWGNNQTVSAPSVASTAKRRQTNHLYLNAGTEIKDEASAQAIADGVYAMVQLLSPEWSLEISVPKSCRVEELIDAQWVAVDPMTVEAGYFIRIPDLDQGALGPELEVPQGGFVTRMGWTNKTSTLSMSVGEPRAPGAVTRRARQVVSQGASPLNIWGYLGRDMSMPLRDVGKVPLLGPQMATTVDPSKPPLTDFALPAVSTQHQTLLPETLPPLPPAVPYQINNADTSGKKGTVRVPPQKILKYSLIVAKESGGAPALTINVRRLSNGVLVRQITSTGATLSSTGLYTKIDQVISPPVVVEKPDHLVFEVPEGGEDTGMTGDNDWVTIDFDSVRYFPEYPGDKAPQTGKRF